MYPLVVKNCKFDQNGTKIVDFTCVNGEDNLHFRIFTFLKKQFMYVHCIGEIPVKRRFLFTIIFNLPSRLISGLI